ncbi:hypothetical protein PHLCEN_2v2640 [Hermanssonia centrifuga]|uniref:Uncharacterized protein n=1 Tax=Hermanssonia centrifuga TaxID=98765 RepID=A0A2R6RIM6_9APHY|nr:hypothetical protein PHLCEN_2v2640 [Hermanssonia centrifuga]
MSTGPEFYKKWRGECKVPGLRLLKRNALLKATVTDHSISSGNSDIGSNHLYTTDVLSGLRSATSWREVLIQGSYGPRPRLSHMWEGGE